MRSFGFHPQDDEITVILSVSEESQYLCSGISTYYIYLSFTFVQDDCKSPHTSLFTNHRKIDCRAIARNGRKYVITKPILRDVKREATC